LRPDSSTFGQWYGEELTSENRKMLYAPKGCAHGFVTLSDACEVWYLVDEFYSPEYERGVRWDDPEFGIQWPLTPVVMSDKDKSWPDFNRPFHLPAAREVRG
jgi:dTDP-4-dehydrorhamnose 3,5-epimerase